MESMEESVVSDLQAGMNLSFCGNVSPLGLGPDYDLQQSSLDLLKAELKVYYIISINISFNQSDGLFTL